MNLYSAVQINIAKDCVSTAVVHGTSDYAFLDIRVREGGMGGMRLSTRNIGHLKVSKAVCYLSRLFSCKREETLGFRNHAKRNGGWTAMN